MKYCEVKSGVCCGEGTEVIAYTSVFGNTDMVLCCVKCFHAVKMMEPCRTVFVDTRSELLAPMLDEVGHVKFMGMR